MKVELHVGQYLDLWGAAQRDQTIDRATSVILYKTAKYSVERPLHLGAATDRRRRRASRTRPALDA